MAAAVNSALTCLVGALLSIVVVVVVSPYTVLALIPLGLLYYRWPLSVCVATAVKLSAILSLLSFCWDCCTIGMF
jgi:hypothetical protein